MQLIVLYLLFIYCTFYWGGTLCSTLVPCVVPLVPCPQVWVRALTEAVDSVLQDMRVHFAMLHNGLGPAVDAKTLLRRHAPPPPTPARPSGPVCPDCVCRLTPTPTLPISTTHPSLTPLASP